MVVDFLLCRAELGVLSGEIGLEEDLRFGAGLGGGRIQPFEQVERVDRMNGRERGGRLSGLVRLQMTDEVPSRPGQSRRGRDLPLRFLDLVFAEIPLTGLPCRADVVGIERLGDGNQGDIRRTATGAPGGIVDARSDRREVLRDRLDGGNSVWSTAGWIRTVDRYCVVTS